MDSRFVIGLLSILMVFLSGTSFAQNRYFDDGVNGITLQAGVVGAENATGFGAAANFTLFGRVDLGLGYAAPESKTGVGFINKWEQITPSLGVSLLRPNGSRHFGVDLVLSYTDIKSNHVVFGIDGDSRSAGIDIYLAPKNPKDISILPTIGIAYVRARAWRDADENVSAVDEVIESAMIGFEVSILIHQKYMIVPALTIFDGETTGSFMVGMVLFPKW